MAGNIAFHPAPGLGDLLPGFYAVPQNPFEMAETGITRTPSIGDILPAAYVVPQNPIKDFVAGQVKPIGQGVGKGYGNVGVGCADGCGCGGSCGGCGGGLGQVSDFSAALSNVGQDMTSGNWSMLPGDLGDLLSAPTVLGLPLWVTLIGAYFAFDLLSSHSVQVGRRR
jgi:hypothetical protein